MPDVETLRSALAKSRRASDREDFVRSIADELKPWKCPEREVRAEVRKTLDELRADLAQPPLGFRNENKRTARDCVVVLEKVKKQLARLPVTFITSLARATYFDETLVIRRVADLDELERRQNEATEKLRKDWIELLERTTRFAEQCKQAILAPIGLISDSGEMIDLAPTGAISKSHYGKQMAATHAVCLIMLVSKKWPAAGDRKTSFCLIASRLFEMVTGEREPNLLRACKYTLAMMRSMETLNEIREREMLSAR